MDGITLLLEVLRHFGYLYGTPKKNRAIVLELCVGSVMELCVRFVSYFMLFFQVTEKANLLDIIDYVQYPPQP